MCINHGMPDTSIFGLPARDIDGNPRVIHGRIDIGAVEKHIESISVSGNIINDTIWTADTVKIVSNIEIQDGAILTIPAGTVIEFQDNYSINVRGTIIAEGKTITLERNFNTPKKLIFDSNHKETVDKI